eukprot:GHVL01024521.1.p1 GENE.GHVL01024521.1~~GHVL01024521.1.p1  ORF type:complete len:184 (+),score=20.36 GHVL01024521.1:52-603(+)
MMNLSLIGIFFFIIVFSNISRADDCCSCHCCDQQFCNDEKEFGNHNDDECDPLDCVIKHSINYIKNCGSNDTVSVRSTSGDCTSTLSTTLKTVAIIVSVIIFLIIVAAIIACCFCCRRRKAKPAVYYPPQTPMTGQPIYGQQSYYGQQPMYGQPPQYMQPQQYGQQSPQPNVLIINNRGDTPN